MNCSNKRLVCIGGWFGFFIVLSCVGALIYCVIIEPSLLGKIIIGLLIPWVLTSSLVICVVRKAAKKLWMLVKK
jgi:hypothetical protein